MRGPNVELAEKACDSISVQELDLGDQTQYRVLAIERDANSLSLGHLFIADMNHFGEAS